METFNTYLVLLKMLTTVSTIQCNYIWGVELKEYINKTSNEFRLQSLGIHSVGVCGYHCLMDTKCISFFFNKAKMECNLHGVLFPESAVLISSQGWRYYQVFGGICQFVKYLVFNISLI